MSLPVTYARALQETLGSASASTSTRRELLSVLEALSSSRDLRLTLYGPFATPEEKDGVLQALGQKLSIGKTTQRFLGLLAQKNRLSALPEITQAFDRATVEASGGVLGEIQSVDPLPDEVIGEFEQAFSKKIGKKVEFRQKQDPALLAGVRVTIEGVTYDGSLRSGLDRMKESMLGAKKEWN